MCIILLLIFIFFMGYIAHVADFFFEILVLFLRKKENSRHASFIYFIYKNFRYIYIILPSAN